MRWAVTFSLARGLRTFRVYAPNPVEAEDRARLLLTLEAVDAEMVRVEKE